MKTLHLLRHAKSSWNEPALDDHERPLSRRGERSAAALAAAWPGMKAKPELVLCSSAVRARATCAALSDVLPAQVPIELDASLYLASATALVARMRRVPETVNELLLIGHNPGLEDLALLLIQHAPHSLRAKLARKLPTGALLSLELDIEHWSVLGLDCATLVRFWPFSATPTERDETKHPSGGSRAKAFEVDKHPSWSDLANAAVSQCRTHAYANLAGALNGNPPSIHQLRVALRRLRVVLRAFEDCFDQRVQERATSKTRVLFRALGRVRELDVIERDVLLELQLAPPHDTGLRIVRERLAKERARRLLRLQAALNQREVSALTRALDALTPRDILETGDKPRSRARRQLDKRLRLVLELAEGKTSNSQRLHALRKELKKLRYRVDVFGEIYARDAARAYAGLLSRLQDRLGVLNDVAVARAALCMRKGSSATPSVANALQHVTSALGTREDDAILGLAADLDALAHARPFWH